MSITRSIRTPIMHRAVEANGFVFVGGTIADDTSVSMGDQTRNILGEIAGYLKEAGTDKSRADAGKPGSAPPAQPSSTTLSAMAAAPAPSSPPSSAASLFALKSIMAPDPSPEPKTSAKPDEAPLAEANAGTVEANEAAPSPVQKTEFAVDLGTANSVNGLRALWRGLMA